jgi:RNA polymerase sigma-70 factor (ECF subfamily)
MSKADHRSDAELLVAARQDAQAFAAFYRRHVWSVLGFFRRRVTDPEAAADLMAETFAAALVSLDRYVATEAEPRAWLFAIARHKLADSIRRGRVRDDARRQLGMVRLELDDDDLDRVDETVGALPDGEVALQALSTLSSDQRHAVTARVIEERSYPDIASELRCSEAVVRKRVSRALQELRTQIEGDT